MRERYEIGWDLLSYADRISSRAQHFLAMSQPFYKCYSASTRPLHAMDDSTGAARPRPFLAERLLTGIDQLSQNVRTAMMDDMKTFLWFGSHDNLNLPFSVYDQRISDQSHLDSGTAATIFIIKAPNVIRPAVQELQQQRASGARNPITLHCGPRNM